MSETILSVEHFLADHGFYATTENCDAIISSFHREMAAGLAGKPSSLRMIPSFIDATRPIAHDTPTLVLDAGGTNLRSACITIDANNQPLMTNKQKTQMPGSVTRVSHAEFFGTFAHEVMHASATTSCNKLGICFSYPADISPTRDARLIRWTKQINAPDVVNCWIGADTCAHLPAPTPRVVVLNDTVATLLAARLAGTSSEAYASHIGFILGTGTNTAYVEQNAAITKCPDLPPNGTMVINTESGAFDKITQSYFDASMDETTADCGKSFFEKMISGVYLGPLGLTIIHEAVRHGLFSRVAARALTAVASLTNCHFDNFCSGNFTPDNPLCAIQLTPIDRATIIALGRAMYERTAKLTAIHLAATTLQAVGNRPQTLPVCINIDGSTYYKTRTIPFAEIVLRELDALLTPRGVATHCIHIDEAPMIGTAIASLITT